MIVWNAPTVIEMSSYVVTNIALPGGLDLTLHFVPSCPSCIGGKMMRNVQGAQ